MTRRHWGWVGAITALGLLLRFVLIGDESAWMDEIYSMGMARAPLGDVLDGVVRDRGNPLGYYVILHGWLQIFGDSIEAARVFSAIAGALAIPLTAKLARNLSFPASVAIGAALLVAFSPPLVYLAREARVFALGSTVVLVHLIAASALVRGDRLRDWALYVVSAAALLYLHYFSVFVLVPTGLYLLIVRPKRWPVVAAAALVALAFVPYLATLSWQASTGVERSADTWWKHAVFMPAFVVVGHTLVWIEQGLVALAVVFAATIVGVWTPVAWALRRRVPWFLVATGIGPIVLAIIFSFVAPLLVGRYAALVFPVFAIAIALAWEHATRGLRVFLMATTGALTLASLVGLYLGHHKDDWRAVGEALDRSRPIYVLPPEAARGVEFYRPELSVELFEPPNAVALTHRLAEDKDAWLVLYRYDPRVTASVEEALRAWPELQIQRAFSSRRLELLHVTAP